MDIPLPTALLVEIRSRLGLAGKRDLSKFARLVGVHASTVTGWLEGRVDTVVFCAKVAELTNRPPHQIQAYLDGELPLAELLPPGQPIYSRNLSEALRALRTLTAAESLVLLAQLAVHLQSSQRAKPQPGSTSDVPGATAAPPPHAVADSEATVAARESFASLAELVSHHWDLLVRSRIARKRLDLLATGGSATTTEIIRIAQAIGLDPDVVIDLNLKTQRKPNGQPNGTSANGSPHS